MATNVRTTSTNHIQSRAGKVGRFLMHLLEMLLAMGAGMGIFHLLEGVIPASSWIADFLKRGTDLHTVLMTVFMTLPMVAWMIVRGHGWRHSVEMAVAMLAPMGAVILLCQLGADAYLPWLAQASSPVMYLGMLAYMLYHHDHFTRRASHATSPATH